MVAIVRVVRMDRTLSQGFDEPCHVAAGMEWLDRHTYTLDAVHPLLARYAITLPLYWAGERFPKFPSGDPRAYNYNDVGNAILGDGGHYKRNLLLARLGVLPFMCLGAMVLYLWTKRYLGNLAACLAVAFFTTTPSILAFSGLAYNDLPAASLQLTFLCLLTLWLQRQTWSMTFVLGLAAGLAVATKYTSLVFLTTSTVAMLVCRWWLHDRSSAPSQTRLRSFAQLLATGCIAMLVVWGTYGFSTGRVQETTGLSPGAMPSFQHFPAPVRGLARSAVLSNPRIPAPEIISGFAEIWVANRVGPSSYLYGHSRNGGWWFFFPVALALKTPLPVILLAIVGSVQLVFLARRRGNCKVLMPLASAIAILCAAMAGRYNVGTRYLLIVVTLLCILAGFGGQFLWKYPQQRLGKAVFFTLLIWQVVVTMSARHDFIAYFNEIAPSDPSKALVVGCDLDCGEDLFRLADELRSRGVSQVRIAVWSSGDLADIGLPSYKVLQPFQPVSGWIAISVRSKRMGHVLHQAYPPEGFSWLDNYRPVAELDKTILIYHIPDIVRP